MLAFLRSCVAVAAVAYPAALAVVVAAFRFVGERWWVTGVGLYLPRIGFALPLPFLLLALLALRMHKLLWTQLVAALLVLFPLMGLVCPSPWSAGAQSGAPSIRILTINANSQLAGDAALVAELVRHSPDILLLQEVAMHHDQLEQLLRAHFSVVTSSTQFIVASRFPIISTATPARVVYQGVSHSPLFLRHTIQTPLGLLIVYEVHPHSPRNSFITVRGHGVPRELLSGRLFRGVNSWEVRENFGLRTLQVQTIGALADRESAPVVIAGDTNVPVLTPLFPSYLSRYQDGFVAAGRGFGYTFPAGRAFLRIDRILASKQLRFSHFEVGCPGVSDHLCVFADLQRAESPSR